jgi:hypothetical protein
MAVKPDLPCKFGGRIREDDRFCRNPEIGNGGPVSFATCVACPLLGSCGPLPPRRPDPGSVLSDILLNKFGVMPFDDDAADCPCRYTINKMNAGGSEWCRENIEEIVDSMIQGLRIKKRWERFVPIGKRWYLKRLAMLAIRTVEDWTPEVVNACHQETAVVEADRS